MILTIKKGVFFLFSTTLLFTSCVSKKKYDEVKLLNDYYKKENADLELMKKDQKELYGKLRNSEVKAENCETEKKELASRYTALQSSFDHLEANLEEILKQNDVLLSSSSLDVQALSEKIAQLEFNLDARERELTTLKHELSSLEGDLENDTTESASRHQRLSEFINQQRAQDAQMNTLKTRIHQALAGLEPKEFAISEKKGRIYILLGDNLLFANGKETVGWKGKQAIARLAEVLKRNPDIVINVEGHTDTAGTAEESWQHSVNRATAIVNILSKNGIDPQRIAASGRAYYFPLATNESKEGKAQNRRTEIILSPKQELFFEILDK